MIRITSGSAKNKRLEVPEIEGIRAVQEKAKLAIFAILEDKVVGARVLDLFAGSGNLGLEALSRGAAWCDFVDSEWKSRESINKNLKNCGFENMGEVFLQDAVKFVGNTVKKYDVVFCDPFYKDTNHKFLMKLLPEIMNDSAVVVFLHADDFDINTILGDSGLQVVKERRFGKSVVSFLRV